MADNREKALPDEAAAETSLDSRIRASEAAAKEAKMSPWESIKLYPKAVAFSAIVSACIIMDGYDRNLLTGLFAFGPFQRRYGELQPDGGYQLPARWQSGLANGQSVGEIMGLFVNGWASEHFGYRRTLLATLAATACFIFILFFAPSVEVLLAGEILCGIPWGVFETLTTVYAAEVCPVGLRAYLTTYVNLCWVLGTLLGQGVLRAFLTSGTSQWAYRVPFAIQWAWPIPLAIGVFLAPESPWWLVRHGQNDKARRALVKLQSTNHSVDNDLDATIAMMKYTHEHEKEVEVGSSYLACFKGVDLRRTELTCVVWAVQNLSGSGFMGYSTYFFQQAGLDSNDAFNIAMAQYAIGAVGTMLSWYLMGRFGRRTLYLAGLTCQTVCLFVTGCLGLAPASNKAVPWAVSIMMVVYTFIYDMTVGPVCYALVPELPAGRLRTRTVVLGRNLYNVINIIMNVIIPYMLNPTAWNWKAKAGFFYAGLAFLCLIWTYFRLPETKNRTYAELDLLFEKKTGARKFKSTSVDIFGVHAEQSRPGSVHEAEAKDEHYQ
ncbi:Sugar/inositol transporter [Niveomyces insectorum RCEF 264]|uniref:Sugar/inositol transporter n=1 Tax=Niveomyces insectorum RCEF 264 TaxID=1081102 RepID=A0A167MSQ0_9HYPO|nr:Sugar/inositol transporter [Niveomyces insectorum RCEF 264]